MIRDAHRAPFYDSPDDGGGGVATADTDTSREPRAFNPSDDLKKLMHDQTEAIKASVKEQALLREKWPEMMAEMRKAMAKDHRRALDGGHPDPDPITMDQYVAIPRTEDLRVEIAKANDACMDAHLYYKSRAAIGECEYDHTKDEHGVPRGMRNLECFKRLQLLRQKAAGDFWQTGGTLAGAEWVPTGYLTEVIDVTRLDTGVPALFREVTIPQGVGTLRVPVKTSKAAWAVVSENTGSFTFPYGAAGAGLTNSGTSYVALTPKKHKGISGMSKEEIEDAIVVVMAEARNELALNGMESLESAYVNGTDGTTLDGAAGAGPAKSYMAGLRYYGLVTNANTVPLGGNALALSYIKLGRAQLGRWGVRPSDVAIITSPGGYIDLVQELDSPVVTVDKMGPRATILSGQLASVFGMPIVVSDEMPVNLQTNGRSSGGAGTLSTTVMVNRTRWRRGMKRGMEIKQIDVVGDDAMVLVGFVRTAFAAAPPTTDDHVSVLINQLR